MHTPRRVGEDTEKGKKGINGDRSREFWNYLFVGVQYIEPFLFSAQIYYLILKNNHTTLSLLLYIGNNLSIIDETLLLYDTYH